MGVKVRHFAEKHSRTFAELLVIIADRDLTRKLFGKKLGKFGYLLGYEKAINCLAKSDGFLRVTKDSRQSR